MMWSTFMIAFIFLSFLCIANANNKVINKNDNKLLIKTDLGLVQGHLNAFNVREWSGIPYAIPPVNELRWEYPIYPQPNNDDNIYEANYIAPGCSQICKLPPGNCPENGVSEDCLYLSVWAPLKPSSLNPKGLYPVLFWIHGGAFEQGLGDCALYNGTNFANKDVITVVFNYRLGAFGFMASTSMKGNYGIMDQRLALDWTKRNIAAFGGDPNDITIAGQSAGAMSVGSHLVSPSMKGSFQKAIMESNPLALPLHNRESASTNADAMMKYCNCNVDDVECMRAKSMDEILVAQDAAPPLNFNDLLINFMPWSPMVEKDGVIPVQPLEAMQNGEVIQVPVLAGSMKDEGQLFVYELFTKPLDQVAYKSVLLATFGVKNYPVINKFYPYDLIDGSTDGRDVLNMLATDLIFYCPLRNATIGYQQSLGLKAMPTYHYRFTHVMSFDCWGADYEFCVGYVCHGSELPFVFNVFYASDEVHYTPTSDEKQLSEDLANIWTNFITHGNPNIGLTIPATGFPLYDKLTDTVLAFDEPGVTLESHFRLNYCAMWDSLGYIY